MQTPKPKMRKMKCVHHCRKRITSRQEGPCGAIPPFSAHTGPGNALI